MSAMYYFHRRNRFEIFPHWSTEMSTVNPQRQKYVLTTLLGAILGGLLVALATKAVPRIMSQMMAGMMKNMMAQKRADGGDFSDI